MAGRSSDARAERARAADIFAVAKRCGAQLKKVTGSEFSGPCPFCGGKDRFSVNVVEKVFNCRGAGIGGDVIAMVEHTRGLDFLGALEFITGEKAPDRGRRPAPDASGDDPPPWEDPSPPRESQKDHEREAVIAGPTKIYSYIDEAGFEAYQVCRYEWHADGVRKKTFRQRRKPRSSDEKETIKGGWVWKIADDEIIPYRLPEIIEAVSEGELVLIAEGEKCADALIEWGLCGATFTAAANRIPRELSRLMNGADVVILQDEDPQKLDKNGKPAVHKNGAPIFPGKDFVERVGRALHGIAKRVRVLEFPELAPKGDVVDWRDNHGGTPVRLFERIRDESRPWAPRKPVSRFGAVSWVDMDKTGPAVDWLVEDLLTVGDKAIIGGASGSGKTFFSMGLATAVMGGTDFLGHKVQQGLVLYQAGESGRGVIGRARALRKHANIPHDLALPMEFLTKRVDLFSENGDVQAFIDEIKAWQDYYIDDVLRLIVIDTLAKASIGAEENSAKEMGIVLANADKIISETKAAVLLVHHMNAEGKKLRGSTAIQANVEQVIGISVDDVTKIRTATVHKMKDGADGREIKFELLSVETGWDSRLNKPVTSCVVLPLGEKAAAKTAEREKGFFLRADEELPFRALVNALDRAGEPPPDGIEAPHHTVVKIKYWFEEFKKITTINPDERDFDKKAASVMKRASEKLQKYKLIYRENPYVWLGSKPVRGFPITFSDKTPPANQAHNPDESDSGDLLSNVKF